MKKISMLATVMTMIACGQGPTAAEVAGGNGTGTGTGAAAQAQVEPQAQAVAPVDQTATPKVSAPAVTTEPTPTPAPATAEPKPNSAPQVPDLVTSFMEAVKSIQVGDTVALGNLKTTFCRPDASSCVSLNIFIPHYMGLNGYSHPQTPAGESDPYLVQGGTYEKGDIYSAYVTVQTYLGKVLAISMIETQQDISVAVENYALNIDYDKQGNWRYSALPDGVAMLPDCVNTPYHPGFIGVDGCRIP